VNIGNWIYIAAYFAAAISVGISSIGAGVGEGYIASNTSYAMMRQPKSSDVLLRTMLVGQAITETGAIFALVIAMLMLFTGPSATNGGIQTIASFLGAGIAIGAGTVGTGLGIGYTCGCACKGIGRNPRIAKLLTTNMLIGAAVAESTAIYSLVIALLLIFVV